MGRRSTTHRATETIAGQHLALSVAAHLARSQLVPDPLSAYDGRHLLDVLDAVGSAICRVAQLYVLDAKSGQRRDLSPTELEGAKTKSGATIVVLRDGQALSGVSVKRTDLRQAIAILRAVGIAELHGATQFADHNPEVTAQPSRALEELRVQMAELEALLDSPLLPAQAEQANGITIAMARHAPDGRIANLAMQLMSAVHEGRRSGDEQNVRVMLARLRAVFDQVCIAGEGPGSRATG